MTRILVRSGMSPFDSYDPYYVLKNNKLGYNAGNLLYAYSAFRLLKRDDTEVISTNYEIKKLNADEINEKFDFFILPLADAFRENFLNQLRGFTSLIKKLKIPCVVLGVGVRDSYEPDLTESKPFDDDVRAFVSAVLDKSAMLGLRGEITSRYLTHLGFVEGTHHTPIGCPSMYTFGDRMKIRELSLHRDSTIAYNSSRKTPGKVRNFIENNIAKYPLHYFVGQENYDLALAYIGKPTKPLAAYPYSLEHPDYMNNRAKFFINIPTWLEFAREMDFSFGTRLHGTVMSMLAGTPGFLMPIDSRTRELAEYHKMARIPAKDIKANMDLQDIAATLDFHEVERVHQKNFSHYVDFLRLNKVPNIYDPGDPVEAPTSFDRMVAGIGYEPSIKPIIHVSADEMVHRLNMFFFDEDSVEGKALK